MEVYMCQCDSPILQQSASDRPPPSVVSEWTQKWRNENLNEASVEQHSIVQWRQANNWGNPPTL